jgi:DNA invertase Pin-like site-specific DNA recombinase
VRLPCYARPPKGHAALGVGFVSLTEALDLTTPTGRAMAGLLSVFAEFEHEILRERIRAGIAEARLNGKHLGRPLSIYIRTGNATRALTRKRTKRVCVASNSTVTTISP